MSQQSGASSELVEISKLNGDFRKNYGKLIGAFLYLRSVSAARGRSLLGSGFLFVVVSAFVAWLKQYGFIGHPPSVADLTLPAPRLGACPHRAAQTQRGTTDCRSTCKPGSDEE
jgi:hypothetical protein